MQSVNILSSFVSQDADLKAKESFASSADSKKESSFSRLVEQHVTDDKKVIADKSTQEKTGTNAATSSNATVENGNSDTNNENRRQENDSALSGTNKKTVSDTNNSSSNEDEQASQTPQVSKEAKEKLDLIETTKKSAHEALAQENIIDKLPNSQKLTESEQFISLLYNSDQTLKTSANSKGQTVALNNQSVQSAIEERFESVDDIEKDKGNNKDPSLDHKLQSFSKNELLARDSLKSNLVGSLNNNSEEEVLTAKSSDQILKEYQQSLQLPQNGHTNSNAPSLTSDQLMKAALSEAEFKNNKITDVAAGVSQVNKNEFINKVDSGIAPLSDEFIGKEKDSANYMTDLAKNSRDNKANPLLNPLESDNTKFGTGEEVELNDELEVKLESMLAAQKTTDSEKTLATSTSTATNSLESLEGKSNSSDSIDLDKVAAERNIQVSKAVENILKEQPLETQAKLAAVPNSQAAAAQAQSEVQQKNQQSALQNSQQNSQQNSAQSIEDAGEDYIDSTLLAVEKSTAQEVKVPSKVTDPTLLRSASDLLAQSVQSTQTKQSNDAYMEHQSSEMLSHTVASDTAQIQKNNAQLQQETISIFRRDFSDAVKDKIMVMINQKIQQFDITLDPPEFGNMQVRVNLQGEQAAVNFVVQNQQAKDALEQNMQKLKDMLSEQGVDVGDANVEQQNQQTNDENGLDHKEQNIAGNKSPLSTLDQEEGNVEHILSTNLFNSPAPGVDYYA